MLRLALFSATAAVAAAGHSPPPPKKLGGGATQLSLVHIVADPEAVCNDGTLPGMFIAQSTAPDTQFDWLV